MKKFPLSLGCLFAFLIMLLTACRSKAVPQTPSATASAIIQSPVPTSIPKPGKCTNIGQSWTSPVDGTTLVCVPMGEFLMGASDNDPLADDNEKPQHTVYLDAYWIDRTEVTNADFAKCMAAGVCQPKVYETTAKSYIPYAVNPAYQNYPAILYEYDVAVAYCHWVGRRLPTEAEWEKAARGTDGRLYPWGNQELDCTLANYYSCNEATVRTPDPTGPSCGYSSCKTTPVRGFPNGVSPYGALNMSGNVWEWVSDWYQPEYYANSPVHNLEGPSTGTYRVIRGGGANSLSQDLRVTRRSSGEPQHYLDGQLGFRCASNADQP